MPSVKHSTSRVGTRSVTRVPASSKGRATADATSKPKASSGVKNPTTIKAFELTMATGSDEGRGGVTSAKHRGLGLPTETEELRLTVTRSAGRWQSQHAAEPGPLLFAMSTGAYLQEIGAGAQADGE